MTPTYAQIAAALPPTATSAAALGVSLAWLRLVAATDAFRGAQCASKN